jgi:hypothetical protein
MAKKGKGGGLRSIVKRAGRVQDIDAPKVETPKKRKLSKKAKNRADFRVRRAAQVEGIANKRNVSMARAWKIFRELSIVEPKGKTVALKTKSLGNLAIRAAGKRGIRVGSTHIEHATILRFGGLKGKFFQGESGAGTSKFTHIKRLMLARDPATGRKIAVHVISIGGVNRLVSRMSRGGKG